MFRTQDEKKQAVTKAQHKYSAASQVESDVLDRLFKLFPEDEWENALIELDDYCGYLGDDRWYDISDLDEMMYGMTPTEIIEESGNIDLSDDYVRNGIWGWETTDEVDYSDYIDTSAIESLIEYSLYKEYISPDDQSTAETLLDIYGYLDDYVTECQQEYFNVQDEPVEPEEAPQEAQEETTI